MNLQKQIELIAPCGMNCAACMAFLREKNHCPGCRGPNDRKSVSVTACKIKNCETFQGGNADYCFECKHFPCKRLKHLDKRYRTKYHMSMLENLANIQAYGIREFVRHEQVRWACCTCGGTICVHTGRCSTCG